MSNYCKHGTYVGDWAGPDYICGACEDGLCVHYEKVSGFAWEDTDGCARCGIAPRPRSVASLAESSRIATCRDRVVYNPGVSLYRLAYPHNMSEADLVVMVAARIEYDERRTADGLGVYANPSYNRAQRAEVAP